MTTRRWVITVPLLAATLFVVSGTRSAEAGPIGYAVDTSSNLYSVDLGTASATLIGNTGQFLEGLAISAGGALFGTDAGGNLYSLNATTGAATLIGGTGLGNIEGLDFRGNTLLGTNFANPTTIYSIDTTTAAPTALATTNPMQGVTRAMAVQGPSTALLLTDTPVFQSLQSVDLTTGATTTLGTVDSASGIYGIDFAGGVLYGLGGNGDEYTINPTNGSVTLVGNTGGQFWLDLTIPASVQSVPEPSTLAIGGLAVALGLAVRLRRRAA